jgi:hypothetical protein
MSAGSVMSSRSVRGVLSGGNTDSSCELPQQTE